MKQAHFCSWRRVIFIISFSTHAYQSYAFLTVPPKSAQYTFFHHPNERKTTSVSLSSTSVDDELCLTPELTTLVEGFKRIPDEKIRYKNLMFLANNLAPVEDDVRVPENKVPGCLSTVHVTCDAVTKEDGKKVVNFRGDSDGVLTKGLLALLIRGFSGCTPDQIEAVNPKFIHVAGIAQTLTPGRNNGFLNMIDVMKKKAKEAVGEAPSEASNEDGEAEIENGEEEEEEESGIVTTFEEREGKPMYNEIMSTLITTLKPTSIELVDNSDQHAGHAGSKGWEESGESHFSLSIVAEAFDGMALVKRHQLIYLVLGETMQKIHALQISAKTPEELQK